MQLPQLYSTFNKLLVTFVPCSYYHTPHLTSSHLLHLSLLHLSISTTSHRNSPRVPPYLPHLSPPLPISHVHNFSLQHRYTPFPNNYAKLTSHHTASTNPTSNSTHNLNSATPCVTPTTQIHTIHQPLHPDSPSLISATPSRTSYRTIRRLHSHIHHTNPH